MISSSSLNKLLVWINSFALKLSVENVSLLYILGETQLWMLHKRALPTNNKNGCHDGYFKYKKHVKDMFLCATWRSEWILRSSDLKDSDLYIRLFWSNHA